MPMADLLKENAAQKLLAKVQSAMFVGASQIDGVTTNQLAFRQPGVDWQIWIEDSPTPLPIQLQIIDKTQPNWPRFLATMSAWNTNPSFDRSIFTFTAPEGARKINFAQIPVGPSLPTGGNPTLPK